MRLSKKKAKLLEFSSIGRSQIGFISVAEQLNDIPFEIKRVFWTYYTPNDVLRGKHAHYKLEQVLIAAAGSITVSTEDVHGKKKDFLLDRPNIGVYLPPDYWHTMQFSHNAVLLSLSSMEYEENDYIRDYNEFLELKHEQ